MSGEKGNNDDRAHMAMQKADTMAREKQDRAARLRAECFWNRRKNGNGYGSYDYGPLRVASPRLSTMATPSVMVAMVLIH